MRFTFYFFQVGILLFFNIAAGVQIGHAQLLDEKNLSKSYLGFLNETSFLFPADMVRNVEYDGDPGWGARAIGEKRSDGGNRSFRSLGFRVNLLAFNVLNNKTNSNEPIVGVTLTANSYYGDGNFLEKSLKEINHDAQYNYVEEKSIYGLRHFSLRPDENLKKIPAMRNFDTYTRTGLKNKVLVFIRCGNSRGEKSLCKHYLQIDELRTRITLNYEKKFLPEWNLIQKNSILRLNDFRN
ncbi:hypothetical protein [Variovorax sp. KBW07]|uniref:hypothetical protein n=1 Tax=Variovorax sp. KBW07 TaxID=2153358 RepID=UPI000F58C572|nr:hypothetical protein [Variovorax sp. KBW07]